MAAQTPSATGLMSKRSSAAKQVAGSKRKRRSERRDFTGASSGCKARTAERVLQGKRRLKAAIGPAWAREAVPFIALIEPTLSVWYHPRKALRARKLPGRAWRRC